MTFEDLRSPCNNWKLKTQGEVSHAEKAKHTPKRAQSHKVWAARRKEMRETGERKRKRARKAKNSLSVPMQVVHAAACVECDREARFPLKLLFAAEPNNRKSEKRERPRLQKYQDVSKRRAHLVCNRVNKSVCISSEGCMSAR